ncbi:electron transport complex subunit RsxB [Polaromonas sp. LjRoot131]|uniref:electron transport complex subunit RsxB n=1 Tax=Polaromonas sp. LjRoot131 TaxID=3342262 RepID=UPI003ED0E1DF
MTSPIASRLAERLNAALPQTQCTRCGYPDCAAYAEAMASGEAAINQCPPGGAEGVRRLAAITGRPVLPLNPDNGTEGPRAMAVIDENWCIGCTLCLKACPTDAIMGSNKMMHTVIEPWCTGCELCIPVCPVDCISLENVTGARTGWDAWSPQQADTAHSRYEFHGRRYPRESAAIPQQTTGSALPAPAEDGPATPAAASQTADSSAERKRAVIEAALARARAKRGPAASG